eukprot:CAMPEP_0171285884 /NCGR_PEP_ID=MMETSP0790-20130122/68720_1 /TAXON_ID=2925 /ORGANISM="Alexandrium catenella, Strain OF101" /LENGTH=124 /DNA_ID=CAMNT_0011755297 /DNA_START=204 /DNA_END=575 /DNA_ORIENTATION=+
MPGRASLLSSGDGRASQENPDKLKHLNSSGEELVRDVRTRSVAPPPGLEEFAATHSLAGRHKEADLDISSSACSTADPDEPTFLLPPTPPSMGKGKWMPFEITATMSPSSVTTQLLRIEQAAPK